MIWWRIGSDTIYTLQLIIYELQPTLIKTCNPLGGHGLVFSIATLFPTLKVSWYPRLISVIRLGPTNGILITSYLSWFFPVSSTCLPLHLLLLKNIENLSLWHVLIRLTSFNPDMFYQRHRHAEMFCQNSTIDVSTLRMPQPLRHQQASSDEMWKSHTNHLGLGTLANRYPGGWLEKWHLLPPVIFLGLPGKYVNWKMAMLFT